VDPSWLLGLGLEYKIITDFLIYNLQFTIFNKGPMSKGQMTKIIGSREFEQMKNLLKLRSHQYAKRQMTWFKRFPEIKWESDNNKINNIVDEYLRGWWAKL
jgi:hypothetical protein